MTQELTIPREADRQAADAVERHHAQMSETLAAMAAAVADAIREAGRAAQVGPVGSARDDLVAWCRHELVPHALAEEGTMYAAAGDTVEARLLVEAMLAEHRVIVGLVDELAAATDPVEAATLARALRTLFEVHLAKENNQVLPLLLATPGVSVADLLGGMHELLGEYA